MQRSGSFSSLRTGPPHTQTSSLLARLQVLEQVLHLMDPGGVDEFTLLHHFPGQRGSVRVGIQTLEADATHTESSVSQDNAGLHNNLAYN